MKFLNAQKTYFKLFFSACGFFFMAITGFSQSFLRNTGGLHELWFNNFDIQRKTLFNKQHWVDDNFIYKDNFADSGLRSNVVGYLKNEWQPGVNTYKRHFKKLPFYDYIGQLYYEEGDDYKIFLNPVLHFNIGKEGNKIISQNTRGVEFKGNLGGERGVGFYSYITENQWVYPSFADSFKNRMDVMPGQIWWKDFKKKGFDYIDARGYITFTPVKKFVKAQFGYDKNFIGFGERSLILGNDAAPYLFLKLNTQFGKHFQYQNLFSKYTDYSPLLGNTLFAPKYGAMHRITAKIGKRTFIGITETVMFQRKDSAHNGYDLNYLNPVIFYRAAEINGGSNDNVIMALDFKQHLKNTIIYGQFVLDEFNLKYVKQNNGWWANKYGYQLGAKYSPQTTAMFSVSAEYNKVQPYTYSHFNTGSSYAHFNQSLAHPLGANFQEVFTRIHWVPNWNFGLRKLKVQQSDGSTNALKIRDLLIINAEFSYAQKGTDSSINAANYGGNIIRPNTTRVQDFGNTFLQGQKVNAFIADVTLSYRIGYASFFDFRTHYRSGSNYIGTGLSFSFGYRLNTELGRWNWF